VATHNEKPEASRGSDCMGFELNSFRKCTKMFKYVIQCQTMLGHEKLFGTDFECNFATTPGATSTFILL
jgi:hypothetical protein